jgi:hypothetical protein
MAKHAETEPLREHVYIALKELWMDKGVQVSTLGAIYQRFYQKIIFLKISDPIRALHFLKFRSQVRTRSGSNNFFGLDCNFYTFYNNLEQKFRTNLSNSTLF